jgi:hypothetical protein
VYDTRAVVIKMYQILAGQRTSNIRCMAAIDQKP